MWGLWKNKPTIVWTQVLDAWFKLTLAALFCSLLHFGNVHSLAEMAAFKDTLVHKLQKLWSCKLFHLRVLQCAVQEHEILKALTITNGDGAVNSLTAVSIGGSTAPAKRGQTAGAPWALFSKQTGMINRVKKWLKEGVQRIGWATQWALWPIGAWGAVTWWWTVGWGGPAAGRCQRCHSGGSAIGFQTCKQFENTLKNKIYTQIWSLLSLCRINTGSPKAVTVQASLLWVFIKRWCIVGQWSTAWAL